MAISVTTLDNETFLTKIRIGVAFAAYGSWYVLTDVIKGSTFVFKNHGGATVPVYGPAMKLMIFNDGDTPVKLSQLTVYAVAH